MVSIIILTYNEEKNIQRAIDSVKKISDDIVIVDSGSIDKTLAIARQSGCRIISHALDDFASQRNRATKHTKYQWVLSMDADEEIPKDLQNEIVTRLKEPIEDAFLIPRRNIIFGKEIKHTRWSPDAHVWLYNKEKGKWVGTIHEEYVTTGSVGILMHGKLHYSHKSVREFIEMLNQYTDEEASRLYKAGNKGGLIPMFFYSARSFIGRFIIKKGFLDGYHGLVLSLLMAFYRFVTWAKVWEKGLK